MRQLGRLKAMDEPNCPWRALSNHFPDFSQSAMDSSRRQFLGQCAVLAVGTRLSKMMPHLVLLGDSIFDNGSYTRGGPDVITQVQGMLPVGWKASLLAQDGATTSNIPAQLSRLPVDASHLILSVGGNDALMQSGILDMRVSSTGQAFSLLAEARDAFDAKYQSVIQACIRTRIPLLIATIYNGSFDDAQYQRRATTALTVFNDVIIQTAIKHRLPVMELRQICDQPEDYANPIEPSSIGGEKIARTIVRMVSSENMRGAHIVGD